MGTFQKITLDTAALDQVRQFPSYRLVSILFPGHPVRERGVFRSPFREDRKPSFSCYTGRSGVAMWKDFATGDGGDNIALYRRIHPELGYAESVDALSNLILGRSAIIGNAGSRQHAYAASMYFPEAARKSFPRMLEPERESVLKVVSETPCSDPSVRPELRSYWRSRGISDGAAACMGLRQVVFENLNRRGMLLTDPDSGSPLTARDGSILHDDGQTLALGIRNDIGGMVLRAPDLPDRKGFKGATSSFISTFLSGGHRPDHSVVFAGEGGGLVENPVYDSRMKRIYINSVQCFTGVSAESASLALAFVSGFMGTHLTGREARSLCAVLDTLKAPVSSEAIVVEGMFDGLSAVEMRGGNLEGTDLVILNSIGNLRWAAPFLARHRRVYLMLDNDSKSLAGQKASSQLASEIRSLASACNLSPAVVVGTPELGKSKDLNEKLMNDKGLVKGGRGVK